MCQNIPAHQNTDCARKILIHPFLAHQQGRPSQNKHKPLLFLVLQKGERGKVTSVNSGTPTFEIAYCARIPGYRVDDHLFGTQHYYWVGNKKKFFFELYDESPVSPPTCRAGGATGSHCCAVQFFSPPQQSKWVRTIQSCHNPRPHHSVINRGNVRFSIEIVGAETY